MRRRAKILGVGALLLAVLCEGATARAQHADVSLYSTANGSGQLVADYDFAPRSLLFESFCVAGFCLYSSTDPGFVTPTVDVPASSRFALDSGTQIAFEIVAIASGASVKIGSAVLDAPGESASLGTATGVHLHPEWQVTVPQGTFGEFAVSFRVRRTSDGPAYATSPTYVLVLTNVPPPAPTLQPTATPTATPSPTPTATPTATPSPSPTVTPATTSSPTPVATAPPTATPASTALDAYLVYKARASRLEPAASDDTLPKDWVVTLDDVLLADEPANAFAADPENHLIVKEQAVANPASLGAGAIAAPSPHYLRYQAKAGREGIGAPLANGKLPRPGAAPSRRWSIVNALGTLDVDTGKVAALWLPSSIDLAGGTPPDPDEATHLVCYGAKTAASPSDQAPATGAAGKARFRKDLQAFASDVFADCALAKDAETASFPGTPVEGRCLIDLKAPKQLCSPAAKSAVQPPRVTSAVVAGSSPGIGDRVLVCYQATLAKKLRDAAAATLVGVPVGSTVTQRDHEKRRLRDGTQVGVAPGNGFPRPIAIDTDKLELLCLPSAVAAIAEP